MYKYILIGLLSFPVHADDWSSLDTKREVAWQVLNVMDWRQTRTIPGSGYYENNPLLGKHPDKDKIDKHFLVGALLHYAISDYFPKYRDIWQNTALVVTGSVVYHNYSIGLKVEF